MKQYASMVKLDLKAGDSPQIPSEESSRTLTVPANESKELVSKTANLELARDYMREKLLPVCTACMMKDLQVASNNYRLKQEMAGIAPQLIKEFEAWSHGWRYYAREELFTYLGEKKQAPISFGTKWLQTSFKEWKCTFGHGVSIEMPAVVISETEYLDWVNRKVRR